MGNEAKVSGILEAGDCRAKLSITVIIEELGEVDIGEWLEGAEFAVWSAGSSVFSGKAC